MFDEDSARHLGGCKRARKFRDSHEKRGADAVVLHSLVKQIVRQQRMRLGANV